MPTQPAILPIAPVLPVSPVYYSGMEQSQLVFQLSALHQTVRTLQLKLNQAVETINTLTGNP